MAANLPERISKWDMYRLFNEGRYHQRLLNGELTSSTEHERPSTIISKTIPPGSISKEVNYYENGALVAVVQNFITPAGLIAASGKPDPKRMCINGITYRWRKQTSLDRSRLSNKQINKILEKTGVDALLTYPRGWWDWMKGFWFNDILGRNDY